MLRFVLRLCLFSSFSLMGVELTRADENRYNVLFIAIDDLRPELGCYGVSRAQTANMDEFSKSAVLFDRHYVQVATCGASRYALLTGRSPAASGVTRSNAAAYAGKSAIKPIEQVGAQTMPELFRRSGYHTICLGKISHTPDGRVYAYNGSGDGRPELPGAWDELPTPFGSWKRGWGIFFAYANGIHREDGQGNKDLMQFTAQRDDDLPDGMLASTAINKLKQLSQSEKPFFLGLGFFKPHLPFVATKQDWEAFEDVDLSIENPTKVDSPYWHSSGEFYNYDAPYKKSNPLSADAQHTARRAYYACVRYVDRQVGRVLKQLDDSGLADNTIVVIWGDHGWHLGEQQIWAKHSPFERANRSVLMIRIPGVSKPGLKTNALTETIDLYPTLIEACQPRLQKTASPLDGKSLLPILTGEKKQIRSAAISYWRDAVSVRTETHRMIYRQPSAQNKKKPTAPYVAIYDLSKDLDNTKNIVQENPELLIQMKKHLVRKEAN